MVASAAFLCEESHRLPHGVTRFGEGSDERIGRDAELRLIDEWCDLNGVLRSAVLAGGVPPIGPHPCAETLAEHGGVQLRRFGTTDA
jgi:hypothetical protein